ncbi:MAG: hypothetical protein JO361_00260 [Gammaproteobacteria bacterium]|nr:hypothetical protein [Gammaproteobacteria bacterium]
MIAAGHDFARMQDYIVGRLSDDERRAFEDRLVRDPALVRELEESLALREGLHRLRAQGYFASASFGVRRSWFWPAGLAAAAVAGLALFLAWQRAVAPAPVLMSALEVHGTHGSMASITARFTFVSVRGDSTPELALPAAGLIEFRAAPASPLPGLPYRVTLNRRDGEVSGERVGLLGGIPVSPDGYVRCFAEAARLRAGRYLLRLEPDAAPSGTAQEFAFNLGDGGARAAR